MSVREEGEGGAEVGEEAREGVEERRVEFGVVDDVREEDDVWKKKFVPLGATGPEEASEVVGGVEPVEAAGPALFCKAVELDIDLEQGHDLRDVGEDHLPDVVGLGARKADGPDAGADVEDDLAAVECHVAPQETDQDEGRVPELAADAEVGLRDEDVLGFSAVGVSSSKTPRAGYAEGILDCHGVGGDRFSSPVVAEGFDGDYPRRSSGFGFFFFVVVVEIVVVPPVVIPRTKLDAAGVGDRSKILFAVVGGDLGQGGLRQVDDRQRPVFFSPEAELVPEACFALAEEGKTQGLLLVDHFVGDVRFGAQGGCFRVERRPTPRQLRRGRAPRPFISSVPQKHGLGVGPRGLVLFEM
mmetsp:Transcript_5077/g.16631  ORF Transcript_5077/g.16631 Transcript_5077/m.16631 type:complete len:356 (+) Transcript_5077:380-1447(+)